MVKPKAGQRVRQDKVPDYQLSRFQDELREALETVSALQLVIADLGRRVGVIKAALDLPMEPFSLRDGQDFYED